MRPSFRNIAASLVGWAIMVLAAGPFPAIAGEHPPASASSDIEWNAGGSLRLRYEWKQGFSLGKPGAVEPQDYLLSQFRIHLKIHHQQQWSLFVEGQDARVLSAFLTNTINDTAPANIFADRFDLHQAYLETHRGNNFGTMLRMGRQKFNLGTQRLVASLEWVNTARVWDAIRINQRLGNQNRSIDIFASRLVPLRPKSFNHHGITGNRMFDSQFHGIYLTDAASFRDIRYELYYLLRLNTQMGDRVHTFGMRFDYRKADWQWDGETMLQTGRYDFLRHHAYAAHIGASHTLLADAARLGVAYNYGSGDSDPQDEQHQTFDNLYPLNHAYYGYMDLFSLQNIHNAEAVLTWMTDERHKLRLAYEGFWLANAQTDAWFNAGGGVIRRADTAASPYVGSEVDVTLATTFQPWHLSALLGYSHFFAGPYVHQTGTSGDADFFFLQSKYVF